MNLTESTMNQFKIHTQETLSKRYGFNPWQSQFNINFILLNSTNYGIKNF